ncbi:thermonuclease family protein [Altererythrobacter aquiaggeris]|uniref:thermonuclease family protein n=1 Tax=Aestuarierythrobacter aquiaggeris TaxID=1898396 RepID=UPI00301A8D85
MKVVTLALLLFSTSANAQIITGQAQVVDGDSLELAGFSIRIHGIDAPELSQTCQRSDEAWQCGQEAKAVLTQLVSNRSIVCTQRDIDQYDRIVASCRTSGYDIGAEMVKGGMAVSLTQFSTAYVKYETRARDLKIGIWGSQFEKPSAYRAANPREVIVSKRRSAPAPVRQPERREVYYRNCREARAAGAAPIYRGQPGYRPEMDGDNDGIACEPYRGRRR